MSGPVHAPQAPRRSRARWIAFVVWLVVFLIAAVPTIWAAVSYASQPEDQHVPAAGGVVTIEEAGDYAVYAESSQTSSGNWAGLRSVTGPSGTQVPVSGPGVQENYTVNDRAGVRIGTFTAPGPGPYRLDGVADGTAPGDELVVGTRTVGSVLGIVFGSIVTVFLLVGGLIGALVLFLVGRRRTPRFPGRPAGGPAAWPGQYPGPHPGPYGAGPVPYGTPPGAGQHGPPPAGAVPAGTAGQAPVAPSEDPTVATRRADGPDDRG